MHLVGSICALSFFLFVTTGASVSAQVAPASATAIPAHSAKAEAIAKLLAQAETIDLARFKLAIDKLADPSLDTAAALREVDRLAAEAKRLAGPGATSAQKISAVRRVIYELGPWNGNRPFAYDMSDPEGTELANKLLPNYLNSHRGNCISMPILFLILADRIGLKVTLSKAPRHVFVRYTDETGKVWNIETTSGANPARDEWYREKGGPFSDQAVASGVYLKTLSRKETLAVMSEVVLQRLAEQKRWEESIGVADAILQAYPDNAPVLVVMGSAFGHMLERDYIARYPRPADIPEEERSRYRFLDEQNLLAFEKAEALGWRETDGANYSAPGKAD